LHWAVKHEGLAVLFSLQLQALKTRQPLIVPFL
jgi:hypothetical protein